MAVVVVIRAKSGIPAVPTPPETVPLFVGDVQFVNNVAPAVLVLLRAVPLVVDVDNIAVVGSVAVLPFLVDGTVTVVVVLLMDGSVAAAVLLSASGDLFRFSAAAAVEQLRHTNVIAKARTSHADSWLMIGVILSLGSGCRSLRSWNWNL